jgi:hypothetical protein
MGTVTATLASAEGYVRVEADWRDFPAARKCWIYRVVNGVATVLRDGDGVPLSGGIAVAFDHEAPLDTSVSYRSSIALNRNGDMETGVTEWTDSSNSGTTGTVVQSFDYYAAGRASAKLTRLTGSTAKAASEMISIPVSASNANPFFETNAANWSGVNGAGVSRDTGVVHSGTGSLLVIPDGVTAVPQAQSEEVAVVAGQSYTYSAWLRVSSGGSASRDVGIAWYNAAHGFLSSNTTTLTPAATVWTQYGPTAVTAPAGAAFARLITTGPGVLAAANTWRLDEAILYDPAAAKRYTLAGRLMVPDFWAGGIGVQLQFYSGTTLVSTVGALNDFTPAPGDWGTYGFTTADPATADGVRLVFGIDGSPTTTFPVYADEMYLTRTDGTTTANSGAVTVPSSGGGWWTDPLHPATKVRLLHDLRSALCSPPAGVVLVGQSGRSRPADSASLEVNDAKYPVGAFNRRKSARQSIVVGTMTAADQAAVEALHDSGAPLFLQLDPRQQYADAYGLCGDLAVEPLAGNWEKPWRVISTPYVEQAAPVGPAEGTLKTRYQDFTKYATFADVMAGGGGVYDRWNRTLTGSFGNATSGEAWTLVGTAADFSTNGTMGRVSLSALNSARRAQLLAVNVRDFDVMVTSSISATITGAGGVGEFAVRCRYVDANNFVDIRIFRNAVGTITMAVRQMVGGVETVTSFPGVTGAVPGSTVNLRLLGYGSTLDGYAWLSTGRQPVTPTISLQNVTMVTPGALELYASLNGSVTNTLPIVAGWSALYLMSRDAVNGSPTWLDGLRGNLVA